MNKISVCMATFNGEKYIKNQIESILNQTKEVDEIIVSDDGSTDKTIEMLKAYGEKIIVIKNKDKGVINNFENALKHCSGDYIILSDQDDIWKDNKVEVLVKWLEKRDLVLHNADIIDGNGELIENKKYYEINKPKVTLIKGLYKNSYIGCCMGFNRKILNLSIPINRSCGMHDIWIGNIAKIFGKIEVIDDVLISYRRHGNNVTQMDAPSKNTLYIKMKLRIGLVKGLIYKVISEYGRKQ